MTEVAALAAVIALRSTSSELPKDSHVLLPSYTQLLTLFESSVFHHDLTRPAHVPYLDPE